MLLFNLGAILHTLGALEVTEGVSDVVGAWAIELTAADVADGVSETLEMGAPVELATVEASVALALALGFPAHPSPGTAMSNA